MISSAEQSIEVPDNPLLIFKIGALGSLPLIALERIAQDFNATYVSSDHIRKAMIDERDAEGRSPKAAQNIKMDAIRRHVFHRTATALENGEDVVLDMFVNTVNSRGFVRDIADRTGALTLALVALITPRQAIERVADWVEQDAFVVPVDRWDAHPVGVAKSMLGHVEDPAPDEGLHYTLEIQGGEEVSSILDQYETGLQRLGLLDPEE